LVELETLEFLEGDRVLVLDTYNRGRADERGERQGLDPRPAGDEVSWCIHMSAGVHTEGQAGYVS
jgi:hypothetical protein